MKKQMATPAKNSPKSTTKNVDLVKKNPENWRIIPGPVGQYSYTLSDTKLSGVFNGHGLTPDTFYNLVSYKNGDNVVLLGTGLSNARGDLHIINDLINVGAAQQWTGDYNGQPAGYKIWLVPAVNVVNGKLAWHPNVFLFETGLVR
jgi:hypothetical protein